MSDPTRDLRQAERSDSLKAFVAAVEHGVEAGLETLNTGDDAGTFQAKIALLIQNDRFNDAADLLHGRQLDAKWAELAVYAQVATRDFAAALANIATAEKDFESWAVDRCRIAFAEAVFEEVLKEVDDTGLSVQTNLSSEEKTALEHVINVLDPLRQEVRLHRRVESAAQRLAVEWSARCYGMRGELSRIADLIDPLIAIKPIPLIVAELVLRHVCDPPKGVVGRLRAEHPDDFRAQFAAALLEREVSGRHVEAFDSLMRIADAASTEGPAAIHGYCQALFEISPNLDDARFDQAKGTVERLLLQDNELALYFDAIALLRANRVDEALRLLRENERTDDGVWWQVLAGALEKSDAQQEAKEAWEKACELVPHPSMVNYFAGLAIQNRRFVDAARMLERAYADHPEDVGILTRLAFAYVNLRRFADAVALFEKLVNLQPSEDVHRFNLAICLAHTGKLEAALSQLEQVSANETPSLQLVGTKVGLLISLSRASEAFSLLEEVKSNYSDHPQFLLLYMSTAHRAGKERAAGMTLRRLQEMHMAGSIEPPALRPVSLDELKNFMEEHRAQRRALLRNVSSGRAPWLFAEALFRTPAFRAWYIHTQELKWFSEDVETSAEYSIYATNGYAVYRGAEGRTLQRIVVPEKHTKVVADLSALITLYKLGCLESAAQFFETLTLPTTYSELMLRETEILTPHQPAMEQQLMRVKEAVDRGRIPVEQADSSSASNQRLDEYEDDADDSVFRLGDLHTALGNSQLLSSNELAELVEVCHKEKAADRSLNLSNEVLIDSTTLRVLAGFDWFGRIVDNARFVISGSDHDRLISELQGYENDRRILEDHKQFWKKIGELAAKFPYQSSQMLMGLQQREEEVDDPPVHFDAAIVAADLDLPLLADDRVCQSYVIHRHDSNRTAAFGSDLLLMSLAEEGFISWESAADGLLQLMRWRYRFVVPDARILKLLADRSKSHLPGPHLREVAAYLQASLRDPGLFCGLENSSPPVPIALRMFIELQNGCCELLRLIWEDDTYKPAQQEAITKWCMQNLLPMMPRGLAYSPHGRRLGQISYAGFLIIMMNYLAMVQPLERANQALRLIATELSLDDEQFLDIAAEAASGKYLD